MSEIKKRTEAEMRAYIEGYVAAISAFRDRIEDAVKKEAELAQTMFNTLEEDHESKNIS